MMVHEKGGNIPRAVDKIDPLSRLWSETYRGFDDVA